jgi:low affinity Fe/Cu permease
MATAQRDSWLARFARRAQIWTGSSAAFGLAVGVVVLWAALGPLFHYSDTWQLVINTGTTITTFWMVFLIQRAQNNDSRALHMKLDEIIAALKGASSRLIKVEQLSESELDDLQGHFEELRRKLTENAADHDRHSIEELLDRAENIATRGQPRCPAAAAGRIDNARCG